MENLESCSLFSCHVKNLLCTPCTGLSPGLNCGCGCGDNRDRTFSVWNDQKVMIIIPRDFNYLSHLMPSAKQSDQLSNDIGISVSCVNIMWCQCDQSFVPRELISPLSGVISPSWSADGQQMTWCTIIVMLICTSQWPVPWGTLTRHTFIGYWPLHRNSTVRYLQRVCDVQIEIFDVTTQYS